MQRSRRSVLFKEFEQLLGSVSPHQRGRSFEHLIAEFLRNNGLHVHRNSRTAKPRQTDLTAEYNNFFFLIETKWKKKPLGSDDVDDLRKRLDRVHPTVIGCILSLSDYYRPAIQEVVRNRTREILLFNAREIYWMFANRTSFWRLVERKLTELRIHASVWFEAVEDQGNDAKAMTRITPEPSTFLAQPGNTAPWTTKSTDWAPVVFAHDLPYVDNYFGGSCVGLEIGLDTDSVTDLGYALLLAHQHFGLSGDGCFAIHQVPYAWHGFGIQPFLNALTSWRERYSAVKLESYHHSEEVSFFHQLDQGMLCLNALQRVADEAFIHGAGIQFHLPGVPVEMQPFQAFCRDLNSELGYFESLRRWRTETIDFHDRILLDCVSLIISTKFRGPSISGAIVKNPFYKKRVEFEKKHAAFRSLGQEEFIFCAFQDWLPANFEPGSLLLLRIEATWAGRSPVIRPVCTWETSRKSKSSPYSEGISDSIDEIPKPMRKGRCYKPEK